LTVLIVVLSFAVSPLAEVQFKTKDDSRIVIDEVAGQMVSLLFLPVGVGWAVWGFVLFRIFDIFKPPPVKWMEDNLGAGGVTADDVMAGIYTLLILQIANLIF